MKRPAPQRRQVPLLAMFATVSLFCVAFALLRPSFAPLNFGSALIGVWVAIPMIGAAIGLPIGCWWVGGIEGALCGAAVGAVAGFVLFYSLALMLFLIHFF
jgi:hypothetical protein